MSVMMSCVMTSVVTCVMTCVVTSVVTSVISVVVVNVGVSSDSLIQNLSLESSLGVNDIIHSPQNAIWLDEGVTSLSNVTISDFSGTLDITGMFICHAIGVLISWIGVNIVVMMPMMAMMSKSMMTMMMSVSMMTSMTPIKLGAGNGDKGQSGDSNESLHVGFA